MGASAFEGRQRYKACCFLPDIPSAFTALSRGEAQPGCQQHISVAQSQLCPAIANVQRTLALTLPWKVAGAGKLLSPSGC